jgi:hypothetical protein
MIPSNACTLRLTAAAGTELAGASFRGTVTGAAYSPPPCSFLLTRLYDPKAFITHAASLGQACAHCPIFPTAASRRSRGRVSVPVWLVILSDQLPVVALVSRYLTNQLIGRGLLPQRVRPQPHPLPPPRLWRGLIGYCPTFRWGIPVCRTDDPRVTHPFAALLRTRKPLSRATCMC